MFKLRITGTKLPDWIAFEIEGRPYRVDYRPTAVGVPYHLCQPGRQALGLINFSQWLKLHTGGTVTWEILWALAESYAAGAKQGFQLADLAEVAKQTCLRIVNKLFHQGFAAQYAEQCSIECCLRHQMKTEMAKAVQVNDLLRLRRCLVVCQTNGWDGLAERCQSLLGANLPPHAPPTTSLLDAELLELAQRVAENYGRTKTNSHE